MNKTLRGANTTPQTTLRNLQRSRVRLLRKLSEGDDRQAAKIGRRALAKANRTVTTGQALPHRLSVPSQELASIIKVDIEVADAIRAQDVELVVKGIHNAFRLAGHSSQSLTPATKLVTTSHLPPAQVAQLIEYLNAPAVIAKEDVSPAAKPTALLFLEYVHQDPLGLKACRHGNSSISGLCHKPPCPEAP
ncbi:hypothetical protein [Amycolatopsis samaneae]|uniref:Uncharacterized protein n=1 Tax=Amycolatopsis samaneae TaxID=664691 RepID=A0ABW5G9Z2_9PSEU